MIVIGYRSLCQNCLDYGRVGKCKHSTVLGEVKCFSDRQRSGRIEEMNFFWINPYINAIVYPDFAAGVKSGHSVGGISNFVNDFWVTTINGLSINV